MSSIFYNDTGEGLPVVFLHGYCETSDIWTGVQNQLSRKFRVITVDLPGFGGSPLLTYEFSLDDVAIEIKNFLDSIGLKRFVLIGHSMGGYIALAFSRLFEDRLLGLGLFHSNIFEDDNAKKESRTKLMDFIKKNGVKTFIKTFVPSLFFSENINSLSEIISSLKKSAAQTPAESVIQYARAMRDRKGSEMSIQNFSQPVMFIIGEKDASVPFQKSLDQISVPKNTHVLRLSDTGHMGMFEKSIESTQFIEGFLSFCK